ncbi:SDR family NAD(P)-dependent oxidoreductase [Chloroflexota bacterium]
MFTLTGKVAVITGSGQGIGKAIALCFAEAGAHIVVVDRMEETAAQTADEIKAKGVRSITIIGDLRRGDVVTNMIEQTLKEFSTIDTLVNNVGGQFSKPFLEYSERGWDTIIEENLKSAFLCTQAVGRVMIEQKKKGSITSIASRDGIDPSPLMAPYGASKAAIINLTKTLSVEWGPHNIRVNAIAPSLIVTAGVREVFRERPEMFERRLKRVPLGRLGEPEDVAKVALFLASDAADYITGVTIPVDGGAITLID